jgi:hypothetical protein
MPAWVIILIVVVVVLGVAAAVLVQRRSAINARRTQELRERFGPEYDRLAGAGSRKAAERELADREAKHAKLDIRQLAEPERARFAEEWQDAQLSFLDDPAKAVREGEDLVKRVMTERGYPLHDDLASQASELSVEHARQLDNLRQAQRISEAASAGRATTEDLRQAMVRYRALFADLLRAGAGDGDLPDPAPAPPPGTRR